MSTAGHTARPDGDVDPALSGLQGLSFGDFWVLHHLAPAPGGRLRRIDLAEPPGLTASGVTCSLLPLQRRGLVTRQRDPRDARVGYASLTDGGRTLAQPAQLSALATAQQATGTVADDQLEGPGAVLGPLAGLPALSR